MAMLPSSVCRVDLAKVMLERRSRVGRRVIEAGPMTAAGSQIICLSTAHGCRHACRLQPDRTTAEPVEGNSGTRGRVRFSTLVSREQN